LYETTNPSPRNPNFSVIWRHLGKDPAPFFFITGAINFDRESRWCQLGGDLFVEQPATTRFITSFPRMSALRSTLAALRVPSMLACRRPRARAFELHPADPITKRLGKELQSAFLHRAHRHRDVTVTGDEDDRNVML